MRCAFGVTLGFCLLLSACQKEAERAQPLGNCPPKDPNCAIVPPGGGGGNGGADAGTAGSSGNAGQVGTLTGGIIGVTSDDFVSGVAFVETAKVEADPPGSVAVQGTYDGNSYSLQNLSVGPDVWIGVTPDQGSAFLPTLQPVNTALTSTADLVVVAANVIDEVYGILTLPEARQPDRAHVVVRFLDAKTLAPVSGVVVTHQGENIAYDAGGTWSDITGETGAAGYAVIVNALSQSFTSKQKLTFQAVGVQGSVDLAMRAGAVTLADVAIAK